MDAKHIVRTFHNTKFIVDDLGQWREAIGSARSIGQDGLSSVRCMIDTHNKHGGIILRWSRNDHTLGTSFQVKFRLFLGGKDSGTFADRVDSRRCPRDTGGVLFRKELNRFGSHHQGTVLVGDFGCELAVHRVVLQEVDGIVNGHEGIVDRDNFGCNDAW